MNTTPAFNSPTNDYGPVQFGAGKVHYGTTKSTHRHGLPIVMGEALCGKSAYRHVGEATYPLTCSACLKTIENRPFWRKAYDRALAAWNKSGKEQGNH